MYEERRVCLYLRGWRRCELPFPGTARDLLSKSGRCVKRFRQGDGGGQRLRADPVNAAKRGRCIAKSIPCQHSDI
jgi:hypothetical protein